MCSAEGTLRTLDPQHKEIAPSTLCLAAGLENRPLRREECREAQLLGGGGTRVIPTWGGAGAGKEDRRMAISYSHIL